MSGLSIAFFILAILSFSAHSQVLNSWASPLSTVTMHATFITSASKGTRITGSITVPANQAYTVYFYRPNQYYPNKPAFQFMQFIGSDSFSSNPVDTTGLWRIEVMPYNPNERFLILVTIGSGQAVQTYVQVARREKMLFGYFQEGQSCNFTVQGISIGQQRDYLVEMYLGGSNLDFSRSYQIFTSAGMANSQYQVACTAPLAGYYYIFLSVSENIMALFPRILVNYQSDNYPCPATSNYQDVNQIFPNCVQFNLNAAYPCLKFDSAANACTQCQSDYNLEDGSCYLSADCGLDSYFHHGSCLPAPANCQNFKLVGGECTQCSIGYVLASTVQGKVCNPLLPPALTQTTQTNTNPPNSYSNQAGKTNFSSAQTTSNSSKTVPTVSGQFNPGNNGNSMSPPPSKSPDITCDPGTYLSQSLCVLYPPHCIEFDANLLICTLCDRFYTFNPSNLGCIPVSVNCLPYFTNINNNCVPFPNNCKSTDMFNNCTQCILNYVFDSSRNCIPKQCGDRQYLFNNQCLTVDPNCDEYNQYSGACLSCKGTYILSSNGTCYPPQYNQMASNGCRSRQYRVGNICNNVDPNCNLFDLYTGFCLSCVDPNKFLDKSSGKCFSNTDICADRYYLDPITKTCLEVSQYCNTFDAATGYCLSCTYGLTLFRGGCMLLTPCGNKQYRNQEGMCVEADPNCKGVDQLTGTCISCQPGYEINPGGVCCYSQNYLLTPTCKAFLSVNCISQRPIFFNCQQCAPGYSLSNGVFGKCRKN